MRLSISQKLIIALLGLTLLVLIATLGLARWSFERGFLDYVNALEQVRLEQVRDELAQEYVTSSGTWTSVTPQRFASLLRNSGPPRSLGAPSRDDAPPPFPRDREGQPDPRHGPGPPPGGGHRGAPTAVYDSDGALIVGEDLAMVSDKTIRVPIVVDGTTIGELRSAPRRQLSSPQETAFSAQQLNASWTIGAVSLALAVGISLLLAKGLLAPLRRMIANVNQLSTGDYSVRMSDNRTDELGKLMSDIDHLSLTLDEGRSSRRRWLADISHELRTPVTVLTGELEALQDGVLDLNQKQVGSLIQEVQRLRYLIDDLYELSVSDIGGMKYEFSTVDLGRILDASVEALNTRAAKRGIETSLENSSVAISADSNRLYQLFQNFFENSLAYTDAPGRIDITLSQTGDRAVVMIQDTPPGASDAECEQLFDPLFRLEASRSRRTGGAGLGLAICRNIVEAHGGLVSASPSSLGGLCIRIEFPLVNGT